jgi:hypothetical protein
MAVSMAFPSQASRTSSYNVAPFDPATLAAVIILLDLVSIAGGELRSP